MKITPNHLSILRILLAVLSVIFFLNVALISRLIALVFLIVAGLTDIWDGWIARRKGMITHTGKILDPIADKILVLGIMTTFCVLGLYSFLWIALIFFREIAVTLIRIYLLGKHIVVQAEKSGKIKTISQTVSIYVSFLYLMQRDYAYDFLPFWNPLLAQIFIFANFFFLAVANGYTLLSGWEFLKTNWSLLRAKGNS